MQIFEETQKIIDSSTYQDELQVILKVVSKELNQTGIVPTALQQTIMVNHINEMIRRSKESEGVPEIDAQMFAEISKESLSSAEVVCQAIGNLMADEKYLLSIHFETVKQN